MRSSRIGFFFVLAVASLQRVRHPSPFPPLDCSAPPQQYIFSRFRFFFKVCFTY
jgi:hypothetical protein